MSHTQQVNVTELDYNQIKENIKAYFKRQDSEFKDWDFEGSGLNTFIDVLAYNTHYNAINAHVTVNESFLDSAQIRSNVVARAKLLGYTPSSITAATGSVSLTFSAATNSDLTTTMTLPRGTSFSGTIDGASYSFITLEAYTSSPTLNNSTGSLEYQFTGVLIHEGSLSTKRYDVDANNPNQKFVISDSSIDTSHMSVKVYDNVNSAIASTYSRFETFTEISPSAQVYFLYENHQENFQVEFGDGVLGKKLTGTNIVEIEYLKTLGLEANNVQSFQFTGSIPVEASALLSMQTTSKSAGGAIKESIDSIRHKAPLSFISQNRAVSASDYNAIISKEFTNLQSLSVWGGEYNDPVKFGKVMIAAKPYGAESLTEIEKNTLLNLLQSKKVLAIQPEIVDPDLIYIYSDILFKYDSNATTLSQGELEGIVRNGIRSYSINALEKFEGVFRYSQFLKTIDSLDASIMSSNANVRVYKNITLTSGRAETIPVAFGMTLGTTDRQRTPIMTSEPFTFNGVEQYIEDEPFGGSGASTNPYPTPESFTPHYMYDTESGVGYYAASYADHLRYLSLGYSHNASGGAGVSSAPYTRNLYTYRLIGTEKNRLTTSIGSLNPETGYLSLNSLLVDRTTTIKLMSYPRSNDIVGKRNQIFSIDTAATGITGEIDSVAVSGESGRTTYNTFNRSY